MSLQPPTTMRILLVEDDADYAALLQQLLAAGGSFDVVCVSSWAHAKAQHPGFDVMLLDLGLPDSAVEDTLTAFRSLDAGTAVVVMSGALTLDREVAALSAGAQEVLHKDEIDEHRLVRTIQRAAARQGVVSGLAAEADHQRRVRERLESDIAFLEDARSLTSSNAARSLGIVPLADAAPKLYARLIEAYTDLLDEVIHAYVYRDVPNPTDRIRALSDQMARLRLGPREVTDIHATALRRKLQTQSQVSEMLRNEGRLLLITVMGYLLAEYRTQAMAVGSNHQGATPAPPTPTDGGAARAAVSSTRTGGST